MQSGLYFQELGEAAESEVWLQVTAVAYDNPIPGFKTDNTINLRLWAAKPDREFDLEAFNTGDYVQVSSSGPLLKPLVILASQKTAEYTIRFAHL